MQEILDYFDPRPWISQVPATDQDYYTLVMEATKATKATKVIEADKTYFGFRFKGLDVLTYIQMFLVRSILVGVEALSSWKISQMQ